MLTKCFHSSGNEARPACACWRTNVNGFWHHSSSTAESNKSTEKNDAPVRETDDENANFKKKRNKCSSCLFGQSKWNRFLIAHFTSVGVCSTSRATDIQLEES